MKFFSHRFFHELTNDRTESGLVNIPDDPNTWPAAWGRIVYTRYSTFPDIILPKSRSGPFDALLRKRKSDIGRIGKNNVTVEQLAHLLRCGYGLQESEEAGREENRMVPSGGKRYPLELYLFLFQDIEGLASGIYHYGVRTHVLEPVMLRKFSAEDIARYTPIRKLHGAEVMICMTAVFSRMVDKYGSRGYRYILLEAGHAAQNMLLAGVEFGVNPLPVGGVDEAAIEKEIGLSASDERVVYALFL